jgi:hypothetical protein
MLGRGHAMRSPQDIWSRASAADGQGEVELRTVSRMQTRRFGFHCALRTWTPVRNLRNSLSEARGDCLQFDIGMVCSGGPSFDSYFCCREIIVCNDISRHCSSQAPLSRSQRLKVLLDLIQRCLLNSCEALRSSHPHLVSLSHEPQGFHARCFAPL